MSKLITTMDLQEIYGVSKQAISKWREKGCPNVKMSERIYLYDLKEVRKWKKNRGEKNG
jgi:phage terminase Nu1 subunit (DNA packaging protein)